MAVNHYENFPVASFLLPARLRPAVQALYAFARGADDIADEGDLSDEERLSGLNRYESELNKIQQQLPTQDSQFKALSHVISEYQLPLAPLHQLLSAFKQDVLVKRYNSYSDLLDYCSRSADPVGQLILHLYGAATEQNIRDSNAICSALQLINFWQDVAVDWNKRRIYIPQEDLQRFNIDEAQIDSGKVDVQWCNLMQFEIQRTRELMLSGAGLPFRIPGRMGWELRAVVQGGLRILEKIEAINMNVFDRRPTLKKWDWLVIATRMINRY